MFTWEYKLRAGHSADPANGACAMDAVNWLAHGKHGDAPECASPVIAAYVIRGNDDMPDDVRQRLIPYLHRIAGSRSDAHEAARVRIMVLAAARIFAAKAMDRAGLFDQAATLRGIPDDATVTEIERICRSAADAAHADAAHAYAAHADAFTWDDYFVVLDAALRAGPEGEPWSVDVRDAGVASYIRSGGLVTA